MDGKKHFPHIFRSEYTGIPLRLHVYSFSIAMDFPLWQCNWNGKNYSWNSVAFLLMYTIYSIYYGQSLHKIVRTYVDTFIGLGGGIFLKVLGELLVKFNHCIQLTDVCNYVCIYIHKCSS